MYDEKVQTYVPYIPPVQFVPVYPVHASGYPVNLNVVPYGSNSINIVRSRSVSTKSMGVMPEGHARGMNSSDNVSECMEERTSGGVFDSAPAATLNCNMDSEPTKSAPVGIYNVQDVGTGYGHEAAFYTETTTFNRATVSPALVVSVRYATRERLITWGVPVDQMSSVTATAPNPFPSSMPSVPAPPGWRG